MASVSGSWHDLQPPSAADCACTAPPCAALRSGNGTQAAFESDPDVLFISSHQSGEAC